MAIDRIVRFTIDPIDTEQMLTTRASLISATRQAYPGLAEARIARIDDQTWIDIWRWDSFGLHPGSRGGVRTHQGGRRRVRRDHRRAIATPPERAQACRGGTSLSR